MKKKKIITVCLVSMLVMCGCNRQVFDTTYNYNKAIVNLADGTVISGAVQSWIDYENSDQIQVKINGVSYLVHSSNITLIAE